MKSHAAPGHRGRLLNPLAGMPAVQAASLQAGAAIRQALK